MAGRRLERQLAESWAPPEWAELTVLVAVSGGADSVALLRAWRPFACPARGGWSPLISIISCASRPVMTRLLSAICAVNWAWPAKSAEPTSLFRPPAKAMGSKRLPATRATNSCKRRPSAWERHFLATAHTADDQAETILHRVFRGTGLAGLAGIPRSRTLGQAVSLLRPMLGLRRADVTAYLAELGQPHRNDESNLDLDFTRNRLRRELLPQLAEQYNPRVIEAILRLGQLAGEAQDLIAGMAAELGDRCVRPDGADRLTIDCLPLISQPPRLVRECLLLASRSSALAGASDGLRRVGAAV